jgi:hypothetical protein
MWRGGRERMGRMRVTEEVVGIDEVIVVLLVI